MAFKVDVPTLGHTHIIYKYLEMLRPRIHLCTAFKVDVPTLWRTHIIYKYLDLLRAQNTFMYRFQGGCPNIRAYTLLYIKYFRFAQAQNNIYVRLSKWMSQHYGVHTLYIDT